MGALEAAGSLLASGGIGTTGVSLFLSVLPDSPDVCVAVFEYAGSPPDDVMGAGVPPLDRPRLQVMCRAGRDDYPTARDLCQQARTVLGAVSEVSNSGVRLLRIAPAGSVMPLGNDEHGRPVVSCNFEAVVG